ncbi:MAG: hypothetical protein K0Q49_1284 [Haloplasmataceae bacterium]|jgi:hypothetical protein|nr:hypothetical protein [Haloplasmataceae bacterium]
MKVKGIKIILKIVLVLFLVWFMTYVCLTPITFKSLGFRWWVFIFLLLPFINSSIKKYSSRTGRKEVKSDFEKRFEHYMNYINFGLISLFVFIIIILVQFASTPMFNSEKHRNLITVIEGKSFEESVENIEQMIIPIVDKSYAAKLGDKKLGETKGLGSQFNTGEYSIIETAGNLYWVAPLEYQGFFKWNNKKAEGVAGYIKVSATNPNEVEFIQTKMKYVPSAFFGQDLYRHVYQKYNHELLDYTPIFEIDDEGNPYFIINTINRKINKTSGIDVSDVILVNAVNGETTKYALTEVPAWVDRNIPSQIIMDQIDHWGRLVKGWWSSITSKTEMLQVSEDFNYIYNNGDFYLMTGVTSVGSDESIVGITLTNMNTKETVLYPISGATEWAAQQSAQGVVQDLGYTASFPILVNYNGIPTYFMTLKDSEGLIKRYAYVNIENYSIVGVGSSILEAKNNYLKTLQNSNNNNLNGELVELTAAVLKIETVNVEGTTYYHILLDTVPNKVFIAQYSVSLELPFTEVGDEVTIKYFNANKPNLNIERLNNLNLSIE